MITAYARTASGLLPLVLSPEATLPDGTVWIDLLHPDDTERATAARLLGVNLPTRLEMEEIEISSRLHADSAAAYLTAGVLVGGDSPDPEVGDLTIVLAGACLVTLRYCEPQAINVFARRIQLQPELASMPEDTLFGLLDTIVDRTADILESIGRRVDDLSRQIFRGDGKLGPVPPPGTPRRRATDRVPQHKRQEQHLQDILMGIGQAGDVNHKVRDSVNGMIRLVTFLGPLLGHKLRAEQMSRLRALDQDLRSLSEHAQFLAHESSFLLDATLGQINIEQNAIIKIFSIMAVVFMPPTLFASIWGMNFHHIPELSFEGGYYIALGVMLISAVLPLAWFRHRGWL